MKKKFRVIVRELTETNTIIFSKTFGFSSFENSAKFFYSEIGSFLYSIDDLYDIFKSETDNKMQLDIFCRGYYRQFILLK